VLASEKLARLPEAPPPAQRESPDPVEQIAAKREWTPAQLRRFRDDAHRARAAHRRERAA
jgi:hypothetical protein